MIARERRNRIKNLVNDNGSISIDELIKQFNVSRMTIWRDLKILEEKGDLIKVHGGAIQTEDIYVREPKFEIKKKTALAEKRSIAKYTAANFVQDGDVIFLDGGSTVMELIPYLKKKNITLLTNGLNTLFLASKYINQVAIISCGGVLREPSMTFVGPEAEHFFHNFKAETLFLSCSGITIENGVMDPNPLEMEVKKAMIQSAKRKILLADSSKIFKRSLSTLIQLNQIDVLITDSNITPENVDILKKNNVDVRIVPIE